jgi:hypothetical protein
LSVVVFKIQVLTHVGWMFWELGAFVALLNHGTNKVIFVYFITCSKVICLCIFHVEWSCCWTWWIFVHVPEVCEVCAM